MNAAVAAFRDVGIAPPVLLSLAKRDEEVFLPGRAEPLRLSRHAFSLRLLQYVRDEAHRFAQQVMCCGIMLMKLVSRSLVHRQNILMR